MERTAVFALLALFASAAAAQQKARPQPADLSARTAMPAYKSAFEDYRPYAEPEVARWRELNEEAGRLGGHIGHVPGSVPPAGAAAPAKPPAHTGHGERK